MSLLAWWHVGFAWWLPGDTELLLQDPSQLQVALGDMVVVLLFSDLAHALLLTQSSISSGASGC